MNNTTHMQNTCSGNDMAQTSANTQKKQKIVLYGLARYQNELIHGGLYQVRCHTDIQKDRGTM